MSHACHHHFWKCHKAPTFCSLLARCRIPCACHGKPHLNFQNRSEHVVFLTFLGLEMRFRPQRRAIFQHVNFKKCSERSWCVLYILTWKCASRHDCVHFFDISTSKSGPNMVCFAHVDFEMCFGPQRCALFRHLNFQKWSEHGVLCAC